MKTTPTLSPDALLAFDALARHGSFTAAAEALHCAKSRISQLIKELEQELGTVLVLRNTRRVALTESGQRLAAHATRLRELLDSVRHDIEQARDSVEGVLRIGCSAGLAQQLLGPLLAVQVGMGESILILAFVVIVIGGIGSIRGALVGALLVGMVDSGGRTLLPMVFESLFGAALAADAAPAVASILIYVLMAAVLFFKPRGLFPAHG